MGKKASARHISEAGNYGDQREYYASRYLLEHAPPNDPEACLRSLEEFDVRWTMLHLGHEKGVHLDRAVGDVIKRLRRQPLRQQQQKKSDGGNPIRALEVGAYIGYSAIRIGRILAEHAPSGSTLLSVEQNGDNARYAGIHVDHAGLDGIVEVRHGRIEECFAPRSTDTNDDSNSNSNKNSNNSSSNDDNNIPADSNTTTPYDLVFLDHRKPFYLRDLKRLESAGAVEAGVTVVIADNVAPREHLQNRADAISRGKRRGPCLCSNKACDFLDHVRRRWSATEVCYGATSKDGISVSVPILAGGP